MFPPCRGVTDWIYVRGVPLILASMRSMGNPRNQSGDAVNDNIQGDVRNVIVNNNRRSCTYKEFLACNPKEYDGKGGAIVYTHWIEKMESVQDMSGCEENQKVKYTAGSFFDFKTLMREELCPSNEMQNLETKLWNHAMVKASHAAYTNRFHELARNVNPINARNPAAARGACFECGGTDHYNSACPRLNRAQGPGVNRPNQALAIDGGQGRRNNSNQARRRAFMLGAEEARQDPNIVTGMDWLSNHKAEIICHEKVVRIPLLDGKVLRVLGERPEEKARHLMSAKAKEQKQEEMVVVRDFLEVFPDDLSGLPPIRKIKFLIELIPRAIPIAKSPYRLAPSKMEELSGQLKEL
ncbi:hypothetical protein Tco_1128229 [Tanacetum coccineum]